MKIQNRKRGISILLCVAMLLGDIPAVGFAAENSGLCEHHAAHTECGYVEGESPCSYVCRSCPQEPEEMTQPEEVTEPEEMTQPEEMTEPTETAGPEQTEPECTGLGDCPAEIHRDNCERKMAAEKAGADKAAADAVMAQIETLPSLKALQTKPMADQRRDYEQVQAVYGAYCLLSSEQQALLPSGEEVFKPYFDYFNSMVSLTWSGSGTSSRPFLIYTEQELRDLAQQVKNGNTYHGVYFRLANSITLTGSWTPIGTETNRFCGTFDGNGCTVSGLTASGDYIGLFGYVGSGAVIRNLKLSEISMAGAYYVAGVAAYVDAGSGSVTISDCSVSGTIIGEQEDEDGEEYGKYTGGIAAYVAATEGTVLIENCTMSGKCSGDMYVGGIVGYGTSSGQKLTIRNCVNRASIPTGSNSDGCGGIAGSLSAAAVISCINYGHVSGNAYSEDNGSSWLGGISGYATSCQFTGCANFGDISTFFAGGITPDQYGNNVVDSCLNAGRLSHSSDGYGYALIRSGSVLNSYYLSGTGSGISGATSVSSSQLASGAVAHALREYFGQSIGTDSRPVPLTEKNRVYRVSVTGEASGAFYVNYGDTVVLPELSSCTAYFVGDTKFDPSTPITQDYALAAKGYHNYVDGVCIYCGNEGIDYLDVGTCGASVAWTLMKDGTLRISGSGTMADYSASNPAPWDIYHDSIRSVWIESGVTGIGDYAFHFLTYVTSVSISDTVTVIGDRAFDNLSNLTSITIGDSVTEIGDFAFAFCSMLTDLTLGKRVKTIGENAFYQCSSLARITVPASVTTLGDGAFMYCTDLEYISLSKGLETIGVNALSETAITDLRIPATVTRIGGYAFAYCEDLTLVTFLGAAPEIASTAFSGDTASCHVPAYDSSWTANVQQQFGGILTWAIGSGTCGDAVNWMIDFNGSLIISGTGEMYSYSSGTAPWYSVKDQILSVLIGTGVTKIGDYAFSWCSNLRSVTIADSVTEIGTASTYSSYGRSFQYCTSLTQITIPKSVTAIAAGSFYGCTGLTAINVESGNTAYSSADGVLYDRSQYILHSYPAGKTGAFTVPSTVNTIGAYAFADCDGLTGITLSSGVKIIEKCAFVNCDGLTEIMFPSSVTSIGDQSFDCKGLKHIVFEGSPPDINSFAFYNVTATVDYPLADPAWTSSMLNSYGGTLIWNSGSGTCGTGVQWQLTYRSGYATLVISGSGVMDDYTSGTQPWNDQLASIRTIEVGSGVTSVGAYAFYNSNNLSTVRLADSVKSIGNCAFDYCSNLKTLTWGNGVQTIGDNAFRGAGLTEIRFPGSLKTIGQNSFHSCLSLKSVTFGSDMQTIGYLAFGSCSALETVDLGSGVTTLDSYAFNNCGKLTKIVIPASVTSIGSYAFRLCPNLQYVEFLGNAPTINSYAFSGVTCNAYYLASKSGWTSGKLTNYGGTLTWGALSQRGSCGTKAEWFLDTAGNLYICGGYMAAYSETSRAPWYAYRANIKKVTLRGVTSIGAYAFSGCSALRDFSVPSTVSSVGNYAFAGCSGLQIVIFGGSAPSFGANAFSGVTCEVWYPSANYWSASVRKDYGGTLTWKSTTATGSCGTDAKWALDNSGTLRIVGSGAMDSYSSGTQPWYSSSSSIQSVVIGNEITNVGTYAFCNCTALRTVTIGENVATVNNYAFSGCSALSTITFLGSAPSISSYSFRYVTATACYPLADTTWTTSKQQNYGGTITWQGVCTSHKVTAAPAVAPTCTSAGLTEGSYCSLCSEVLLAQEVIPARGHFAMGPDRVEVPADTLEADCLRSVVCTVCHQTVKAALGHRICEVRTVEADPLTVSNTSTYPFTLTNGTYYSTNTAHSSTGDLWITAQYACTLTLNYGVSSENNFDKLSILVNNMSYSTISGEVTNQTLTLTLTAGDLVTVRYKKDGSQNSGQDRGWVTLDYDHVMVERVTDIPAETGEPDCTNGVVCAYCETVVKEALGHRVIRQLPAAEIPFEVVNTSAVPFTLTDGVYYSGNHGANSASDLLIRAKSACSLTLHCGVSCEATYDKLSILKNGSAIRTISGLETADIIVTLSVGDVITVRYSKDSSVNKNDDCGWVRIAYDSGPTQEILPADTVGPGCEDVVCDFCQTVVKEALDHDWDEGVEAVSPTETAEGEMCFTCRRCGETRTEAIPVLEHTHRYTATTTPPTCETDGYTMYTCSCSDSYVETLPATGHTETIDQAVAPTCTDTGLTEGKHCSVCAKVLIAQKSVPAKEHLWQNDICSNCGAERLYRVDLNEAVPETVHSVWIDGVEYPVQTDGDCCYVDLPEGNARTMVAYTYNAGSRSADQSRYPVGMTVWILEKRDGVYAATRQEAFDDILQYSGMSIRVTGKKGIRMITSIETDKKNALVSDGLEGYTLKEYGTLICWASRLEEGEPLVLGQSYVVSNYAYRQGVADPVFDYDGDRMQYTNVLVNFTDEQCGKEMALRPYMILADAEGHEFTLYGGIVERSIGYIAYQNRDTFAPGTDAYSYIWDIIRSVYGDAYDAEYKGE